MCARSFGDVILTADGKRALTENGVMNGNQSLKIKMRLRVETFVIYLDINDSSFF